MLLLMTFEAIPTWARRTAAERYVSSGDVGIDSLVIRINAMLRDHQADQTGELQVDALVQLRSHNTRQGLAGRMLPHLLPFQGRQGNDTHGIGYVQARYHWPGGMRTHISDVRSNRSRYARHYLSDFDQMMLPLSGIRLSDGRTTGKTYVMPFTDDGLLQYSYTRTAIPPYLIHYADSCGQPFPTSAIAIHYHPLRPHHTLLTGDVVIDTLSLQMLAISYAGRIDMALTEGYTLLEPIDAVVHRLPMPRHSHTRIDYRYGNTRGYNTYDAHFYVGNVQPLDSLHRWSQSLDLTLPYNTDRDSLPSLDTFGAIMTADTVALATDSVMATLLDDRYRPYLTLSEHLVDGSRLSDEDNQLRIYGPLDPASLGYDKTNGFTIRERLRWQHWFRNQSDLTLRLDAGYAFGRKEFRLNSEVTWNFAPRQRGHVTLNFNRNQSGFSSKFIKTINEALKEYDPKTDFYDLGIDYFQLYQTRLELGTELTNGLMLYGGLTYNYRTPVRHGKLKISQEHSQELVDAHYSDLSPYLRLEWTPRQYYIMEGRRKVYVQSPSPTVAVEVTRSIPDIAGTQSNYGRAELDIQQSIRFGASRIFSYRTGTGAFFRQHGEYFINYRYFARKLYPTGWNDERVGGCFHLLDEYWYSSSPSYVQLHTLYETPFGLLNRLGSISKYIIKERIYASALWSEGKNSYVEGGYGIANNYFSCGFFVGFKGLGYHSCGFKFRIELGHHL